MDSQADFQAKTWDKTFLVNCLPACRGGRRWGWRGRGGAAAIWWTSSRRLATPAGCAGTTSIWNGGGLMTRAIITRLKHELICHPNVPTIPPGGTGRTNWIWHRKLKYSICCLRDVIQKIGRNLSSSIYNFRSKVQLDHPVFVLMKFWFLCWWLISICLTSVRVWLQV